MTKNNFLLWLAVLPAAIIGGLLSTVVLHLFLYYTLTNFFSPYPPLPEQILTPLVFNCCFILTGAYVAPRYKFPISLLLFSLILFFVGGLLFIVWNQASWFGNELNFYGNGAAPISGIAGCFIALYLVYHEYSPATSTVHTLTPIVHRSWQVTEYSVLKNFAILHLDDHRLMLNGVQNFIKKIRPAYTFVTFAHPDEALSFIRHTTEEYGKIDCIITDFNHPGMNGLEFAQQIRSSLDPYLQNIPIILLSMVCSEPLPDFMQAWENQKIFDYCLSKSVNAPIIVASIIEAIRERKSITSINMPLTGSA